MKRGLEFNKKKILRNLICSRNEDFLLSGVKYGLPDIKLPLFNIKYIQSEKNFCYAILYNSDQSNLFLPVSIGELEKILINYGFLRTHKSYIVNASFIDYKSADFNDSIKLISDDIIPLAKRRKTVFLNILSDLGLLSPVY